MRKFAQVTRDHQRPPYFGITIFWGFIEFGRGWAGWHCWISPWLMISDTGIHWGRD